MATSVGDFLRETRTSRGLTLEQASQATHIRKNYLEALENEQRDALPSAVQGRGFLRLYAGYLNLPAEELIKAWEGKASLEAVLGQSDHDTRTTAPQTDAEPPAPLPEPPPAPVQTAPLPAQDITAPPQPPAPQAEEGPIPVEFQDAAATSPVAAGSNAIFVEIGAQLRKQRELLGLSRAEVERFTRLRQHYLQAIEEGRMDLLPSPVQGRGMLSNYASFLNLNEDALMLRYAEGLQMRRLERMPAEPPTPLLQGKRRPARAASPIRRLLTPDLVFGAIVVAAIVFFAVRTISSINMAQSLDEQPTARAIAEILLTPEETTLPTEAPGETTPNPAQETPANATQVAGLENANITLTPTVEPTLAPINNDPLQVYIIAHQRAYLRVIVDNKEKFNGRVVPGNAYAYSGSKKIEILTGNAAAIQVFFNQNDLGTLGVAGQVAGLVFLPDGMVTATPASTPTPTPGPAATETLRPTPTLPATLTVTPLIP